MIKCLLIYLWIYIGLFHMIEAGDDDEHVHIKLHMTGGQKKRAQIHQHVHQHHKKRHTASVSHLDSRHHHRHHHHHAPTTATTSTTNLYHESPHNYLAGITATSSSSLLVPQNHVFHQAAHTKKSPSSTTLSMNGQLLNMEEEVYGEEDVGGESVVGVDANDGGDMLIPSYVAKTFASFPQPTTTYETEVIPHNVEGFNVVSEGWDGLEKELEEDNEITGPTARGKGSIESIVVAEQIQNYPRHKPSGTSSAKTIRNEQLLQQLLQQQHNDHAEITTADAYKSNRHRSNKFQPENDYRSEDDMTEAEIYSSSAMATRHNSAQSFNRPREDVVQSGSVKTLTVDDIWSQLQQQYLNKYSPQAQPLTSPDSEEQLFSTTPTKTQQKRKRNTKRQRQTKPTSSTSSYSISWPSKSFNYAGNKHPTRYHLQPIKQQQQQQQHSYDDFNSPPSATAFSGASSLSSHRDTDLFVTRPSFSRLNTHSDEDDTVEAHEETAAETGEGAEDDDFETYGDESFEETVYQRGKKFSSHPTHVQHSPASDSFFSTQDRYGSYSTPVAATVATNVQPSTYHPNLVSSTLPSFVTSSTTNSFLPTISYPPTSYQWRTQQNYPASYHSYLLQHQQQQETQWPAAEQYAEQQSSSALRLPKATIIEAPNEIASFKLSPTQSHDFTELASSSSTSDASTISTAQPTARYKKRKNRTKPKRNRIVVI